MGFKTFISMFASERPKSDMESIANEIVKDEQFPATVDLESISNYVKTQASWLELEKQNAVKKAYALYASAYGITVDWQHAIDFIESNNPQQFNALGGQEKEIILNWISKNIEPFRTEKTYNLKRNSYRLKHNFEFSEGGFHVTNGQFKGAMLASGFIPKDYDETNWVFCVGKHAGLSVM